MTTQNHYVVIGLGSIGRRHAINLAGLDPEARLTFVRHSGTEDDLTQSLGARVVTSLDEIYGERVDLAVLCTPSANHIDLLPALIEVGWPLLIEKPIVTELSDCDIVAELLSSAVPSVRAAGFNLRYLRSLRAVKSALSRAQLGRCVRATFIAGQSLTTWRPGVDYRSVYSADRNRGGGVELDLSHEFDVARWWFGELRVIGSLAGTFSDLEIDSHDTSVVTMLPISGSAPIVVVALDYVAPQRVRWYEVVGTRARFEWNLAGSLSGSTHETTSVVTDSAADFDIGDSYIAMLRAVLEAAERGAIGRAGPQSLEDGLASTRLALEARELGDAT